MSHYELIPGTLLRGEIDPIRLALISQTAELAPALDQEFEVVTASTDLLDEDGDGLRADVFLVDVRSEPHLELVRQLAVAAGHSVVVLGSPDAGPTVLEYLDAGAADYLSLMTAPIERAARIRAAARRSWRRPREEESGVRLGRIVVSLRRHEVTKDGKVVRLTPNEFNLLQAMIEKADQCASYRDLMVRVWGPEHLTARHHLRVYIRQLREKLEDDPNEPVVILTEWGMGYRLNTKGEDGLVQDRRGAAAFA